MKRIILILLSIISLTSLSSCGQSPVSNGRSLYKAYFMKYLKDPSSFKVYKETYSEDGLTVRWTLDYGAKNGFGAMGRETVSFQTRQSVALDVNDNDMIDINGEMYFRYQLK